MEPSGQTEPGGRAAPESDSRSLGGRALGGALGTRRWLALGVSQRVGEPLAPSRAPCVGLDGARRSLLNAPPHSRRL